MPMRSPFDAGVRCLIAFVVVLVVSACSARGDVTLPIPTRVFVAGGSPGSTLVVVLPGRGDDIDAMRRAGVPLAIQQGWPHADVLLAGATQPYYESGRLAQRLHDEVVAPMRAKGYTTIWMAGASMGGLGTLMYERDHPGELAGLVLLAPYLGETTLLSEIDAAGGLAAWSPGAIARTVDGTNYQRDLWRFLQGRHGDAAWGRRVWLAYGDRDKLRDAVPLFAPLVPRDHVLERRGGHTWRVWTPALTEVFERIAREVPAPAS
jgi:pimeloyl-ACP methyl ester carboxylesterase